MNSITNNLISIEEAKYALKCIKEYSFSVSEAVDSIDSIVNRVRNIDMAKLVNHIIDTKLSPVQQTVIRRCCLEFVSANQCAQELGISLRAVYAARAKGLEIIGGYLEPVVMYFRNLPGRETVPLFVTQSLKTLAAQRKERGSINEIIKNIRVAHSVSEEDIAKMSGVRVKDILSAEKGNRALTVDEIENYSRIFGVNITLEFNEGKVTALWKKQ